MPRKIEDEEFYQLLVTVLNEKNLWGSNIQLHREDLARLCQVRFNGRCVRQGTDLWGGMHAGSVVLFRDANNRDVGRVVLWVGKTVPRNWIGVEIDDDRIKKHRLIPAQPRAKKEPRPDPPSRFDREFDV